MTYTSVEQDEAGVEIRSDGPREGSTSRVDTAFTALGELEIKEHFGNVDTSHGFIEALYQYCCERRAGALSERGARR